MGYCAQADLSNRYGDKELAQLTDEVSGQTPDAAEIQSACDEASAELDTYLGRRYTVPVTAPASVLTLLKGWACTLARLKLWGDRAAPDSGVRRDADDVMAIVKDIATFKADLPGMTVDTAAVTTSFAASQTERAGVMTDGNFAKMVTLP